MLTLYLSTLYYYVEKNDLIYNPLQGCVKVAKGKDFTKALIIKKRSPLEGNDRF